MEVKADVGFFELVSDVVRHHHQVVAIDPHHRQAWVEESDLVDFGGDLHAELCVVSLKAVIELRHVKWVEEVVHPGPHAALVVLKEGSHLFGREEDSMALLLL